VDNRVYSYLKSQRVSRTAVRISVIDRDMKGTRKRERERETESGEGEIGETGNLRSPSDCRNVEHLYVYKLYAILRRARFSISLNSIARIFNQAAARSSNREMAGIDIPRERAVFLLLLNLLSNNRERNLYIIS